MCTHRAADRWSRRWARYSVAVLAGFATLETVGLVTEGPDATYSTFLRRWLGQAEPCRHTFLGRGALISFAVWAVAHLGWSKFGLDAPSWARTSSARPRTTH